MRDLHRGRRLELRRMAINGPLSSKLSEVITEDIKEESARVAGLLVGPGRT